MILQGPKHCNVNISMEDVKKILHLTVCIKKSKISKAANSIDKKA